MSTKKDFGEFFGQIMSIEVDIDSDYLEAYAVNNALDSISFDDDAKNTL